MRDLVAGDRLDQYELTELLARSGMASIFKAIDQRSGSTVALKVPHMQFESDVAFYQRFTREEQIGQKLEHPNIVRVLTPEQKSRLYLVMEFAEGRSLRAIMSTKRRFPLDEALDIARQIGRALVYMHERGIVHRDLKPDNVILDAEGQVKLLDFGISMDESARRLTWFGLTPPIGTPDYMAPEQVRGRRGDARTDIYALGTMLYEMVTGSPRTGRQRARYDAGEAQRGSSPPSRGLPQHRPEDRRDHPARHRAVAARALRDGEGHARRSRGAREGGPPGSLGAPRRAAPRAHPAAAPPRDARAPRDRHRRARAAHVDDGSLARPSRAGASAERRRGVGGR